MNPKAASAVFFHIGLQMRYQMKLKLTHDEVRVIELTEMFSAR